MFVDERYCMRSLEAISTSFTAIYVAFDKAAHMGTSSADLHVVMFICIRKVIK